MTACGRSRYAFGLQALFESLRLSNHRLLFTTVPLPQDKVCLVLVLCRAADYPEYFCAPVIFNAPDADPAKRQANRFGVFHFQIIE